MSQRISAVLCFLLVSGLAQSAFGAPSKARQCIASSEAAIALRKDGKLLEAREKYVECAVTACPGSVRAACEKQIEETVAATPTVLFEPKDGAGRDLLSVDVVIDDRPAVKLSGSALELDPGDHRFTFFVEGQTPVSVGFVLHENEKGRRERITIGSPPHPIEKEAVASSSGPSTQNAEISETVGTKLANARGKTQMILGITSGALGLAGVGVGSAFGLMALSEHSNQISTCPPTSCNAAQHAQAVTDHSNVSTNSTISTVAFAAGGVLIAGGVVLALTAPRGGEPRTATSALLVVPSVGPGVAGMLLRGEF